MTRLEQPKRKQKQEWLAELRSVQGSTPASGPGPRPSPDVCEESVRSSHMYTPASMSRLEREDGKHAEHASDGAQSASTPDAAPVVSRIVSPSRALQSFRGKKIRPEERWRKWWRRPKRD